MFAGDGCRVRIMGGVHERFKPAQGEYRCLAFLECYFTHKEEVMGRTASGKRHGQIPAGAVESMFKRVGTARVARMGEPHKVIDALGIDRDLVLRFLGVFSRFEFALKRSGFLRNSKRAEADWNTYADSLRGKFKSVDDSKFTDAVVFIISTPPCRQVVSGSGIDWEGTPPGDGEHREKYVLRLVRVVRNNLFHGGKYPVGPVEDVGRNSELIEASLDVLAQCLQLSPDVRAAFDEVP